VKLVKVEAVDGMASRVDSFGPKDVLGLVLVQHGSCHLNKSSILPLNYPICFFENNCGEKPPNYLIC
jgi:hypothetical protein